MSTPESTNDDGFVGVEPGVRRHLRYELQAAWDAGENRHAQEVMHDLGITYQHATPQSIADQWWFWNCENVPDPLPTYLSELTISPRNAVGCGLSEKMAAAIERGAGSLTPLAPGTSPAAP